MSKHTGEFAIYGKEQDIADRLLWHRSPETANVVRTINTTWGAKIVSLMRRQHLAFVIRAVEEFVSEEFFTETSDFHIRCKFIPSQKEVAEGAVFDQQKVVPKDGKNAGRDVRTIMVFLPPDGCPLCPSKSPDRECHGPDECKSFPDPQKVRFVIAHELGHVVHSFVKGKQYFPKVSEEDFACLLGLILIFGRIDQYASKKAIFQSPWLEVLDSFAKWRNHGKRANADVVPNDKENI